MRLRGLSHLPVLLSLLCTGWLDPSGPVGSGCVGPRPLPLASHWTTHRRKNPDSTSPAWQLARVRKGHHWLLAFKWVKPDHPWDGIARRYYRDALREALLYDDPRWRNLKGAKSPLVTEEGGGVKPAVSPFGSVE